VVVDSFGQANEKLADFKPKKKWYRRFCKRSAVAVILKNSELGLEALMIKRAEREGDPWSGHMGFPGGRSEQSDQNILETARRETWEEIGLETQEHARYLGRLSDILTRPHRGRKPMVVTPYLFTIDEVPNLNTNHEVADVIWVPLAFLADVNNRESMQWKMKKINVSLPCYFYQQQRIWGLSLMMLDELVSLVRR
jgi:8-oxo-dGTP pyrophosphatase MutT (NUDIX family)